MKFILIILVVFTTNYVFANEIENSEVEVINLYESKSLDQMVLENLNTEDDIDEGNKEVVENLNDNNGNGTNEVEVKQINNFKESFIFKNDTKYLKNYFANLEKINSRILQRQMIEVLENLELKLENEKDREILFLIVDYSCMEMGGTMKTAGKFDEAHNGA